MSAMACQPSAPKGLIESHGFAHLCKINEFAYIHRLKLKGLLCFSVSGIISAGLFACTQPLWINKGLLGNSSAALQSDGISTFIFILKLCLWKAGTTKAEGCFCGRALDGKDINSSLWVLQPHLCESSGPRWSFLLSLEIPLRKFSRRGRFVKMIHGNDLRAVKFFQLHLMKASGLDSPLGFASALQKAGAWGKPDCVVQVWLLFRERAVPGTTARIAGQPESLLQKIQQSLQYMTVCTRSPWDH